ncbi:MAG: hypothetical protein AAFW89_01520 [Bacteroidota bacterium]
MIELEIVIWLSLGSAFGTLFVYLAERSAFTERILGIGLIVACCVYVFFGLLSGDVMWIFIETSGLLLYSCFVLLGWKYKFSWLGIGWFLHHVWDYPLHLRWEGGDIAPDWYVLFCISFDVIVGLYIIIDLHRDNMDIDLLQKG